MSRLLNFLGDEDRAVAGLFGAKWFQTISGTVGRAQGAGGGVKRWWGPAAAAPIDLGARLFGAPANHCRRWAETELRMSQELGADGA